MRLYNKSRRPLELHLSTGEVCVPAHSWYDGLPDNIESPEVDILGQVSSMKLRGDIQLSPDLPKEPTPAVVERPKRSKD